jgi:biotin--protein ligase
LGVKWPNDIYHYSNETKTRTKIGGILVTTSITGMMVSAAIGCGVNLSNAKPTMSLNELIEMQRSFTKLKSAPLTLEHYLAVVFNQLELLTDLISAGKIQQVIDLYHQHWLHRSVIIYFLYICLIC